MTRPLSPLIAQRLSREGVAAGEGYFGPWMASIYQRRS